MDDTGNLDDLAAKILQEDVDDDEHVQEPSCGCDAGQGKRVIPGIP
jgi:hypothetical protein